mgnify:FL=1
MVTMNRADTFTAGAEIALRDLAVRAGELPLLSGIDLDLESRGFVGLVGPMGSGKSTLLKFLCGWTARQGLAAEHRLATYRGQPLGPGNRPALVAQRPREEAESLPDSARLLNLRHALIDEAAQTQTDHMAICVDEPSAGLFDDHGHEIMQALAGLARDRLVFVASHNLDHLRGRCARVVLLGRGTIVADAPAERFFAGAAGPLAEHFLRTGGLVMPRPDTDPRSLAPEHRPPPSGFTADLLPAGGEGWVMPGRLKICRNRAGDAGREFDLVYRLSRRALCVSERGKIRSRRSIAGADDAAQACAELAADLDYGQRILLNTGADPGTAAEFLGAFLVCMGTAPDKALGALSRCLPGQELAPGLEGWLWDLDLAYALSDR